MPKRSYTDQENTMILREGPGCKTPQDRAEFARNFNKRFGNPQRSPQALRTQLHRLQAERDGGSRMPGIKDFDRLRVLAGRMEKRFKRLLAGKRHPRRGEKGTKALRAEIKKILTENRGLRKANRELDRQLTRTSRQLASFLKAMSRAQGALVVHSRAGRR